MSRKILTAVVVAGLAFGGTALAQTAPDNSADTSTNSMSKSDAMPGMADTSSDMGNMGTGASSSKIGTGTTSHGATGAGGANSGVMSPSAPGTTGHGATGANPNSTGGVNN